MIFFAQMFCVTSPEYPVMLGMIDDQRIVLDEAIELMKKKFKAYAAEENFNTGGATMIDARRTQFSSLANALAAMRKDGVPIECLVPQPDPSKSMMLFSPALGVTFN